MEPVFEAELVVRDDRGQNSTAWKLKLQITQPAAQSQVAAGPQPSSPRFTKYGSAITELVNEHCQEYPPGTPPLPEAEVARLAGQVASWERHARGLTREFAFEDFGRAFGLVAQVALLAEAEGHHPRIELEWGRAAFTTWTHTAGGLTRNDFILAAKIDQLARV